MPIAFLGFGAVMSGYAWLQTAGWRYGAASVFFAALTRYFRLGAGPFVSAPIAFAAGAVLTSRRGDGPGLAATAARRPREAANMAEDERLGLKYASEVMADQLRTLWGPPMHSDDTITIGAPPS